MNRNALEASLQMEATLSPESVIGLTLPDHENASNDLAHGERRSALSFSSSHVVDFPELARICGKHRSKNLKHTIYVNMHLAGRLPFFDVFGRFPIGNGRLRFVAETFGKVEVKKS